LFVIGWSPSAVELNDLFPPSTDAARLGNLRERPMSGVDLASIAFVAIAVIVFLVRVVEGRIAAFLIAFDELTTD
jgi:hypothetical protein